MCEDDFVVTPAMRAYLAAFDDFILRRKPAAEAVAAKDQAFQALLSDRPAVKTCKHGHLVAGENRVRNGRSGYWRCRECLRITARRTRARNRAVLHGA